MLKVNNIYWLAGKLKRVGVTSENRVFRGAPERSTDSTVAGDAFSRSSLTTWLQQNIKENVQEADS